ncbi:hypothetical protein TVAG_311400 [Trichomonas vaginalis G3]|uniref:Baseplate structural protein Gp10 C-terminal domain-containing protein n=2 Tax=Trichomonas vaginalis (strain ATCC PRA-98 / G3) TaxID=412133 RepID=A2FX66_TRIV3|nr:hypothetical protein TVAG_311400 [Trichomonas vaginalis G3]|eukprot:XP_001303442.1 hypothetical protein [Trichomonas vaginalis G3]
MSNETASMREIQHNRQLIIQALNKNTTNFSNYSKISESLKEGNLKLTLNPMTDEFLFQDKKNHTVCINPTKGTLNEKPINELLLKADVDNKADKTYVDDAIAKEEERANKAYATKEHTHPELADKTYVDNKMSSEVTRAENEYSKKTHTHTSFTTFTADDITLNTTLPSKGPTIPPATSLVDTLMSNDNSIIHLRQELNVLKQILPNLIYPVGSLYVSMNSTRPEVVLGFGTWTQIVDRFLYCANSSKETGGSKTISGENLPAHSHYIDLSTSREGWHKHRYWEWSGMTKGKGYDVKDDVQFAINCYWSDTQGGGDHSHFVSGYTQTTGQSKDYMPPYMTVYAWYRNA